MIGKVVPKNIQLVILLAFLAIVPLTISFFSSGKKQAASPMHLISSDAIDESFQNSLSSPGTKTSPIKTVFLIVMENKDWASIKGSSSAAYINNSLLPNASYASQYYNAPKLHPSEPNYLWLEAGTNLNVKTDDAPATNHQATTKHLVTMLENNGINWKSYQEDISGAECPLQPTGLYDPRHNPMVYFDDVTNSNSNDSTYCITHVRPYSEMLQDLQNNTVARYNFITPNLCNDMHDTNGCATTDSVKNGDTWLSTAVPQIMQSQAYKDGGAIFITWDEDSNEQSNADAQDNPIGMIVLSPYGKGNGYTNTVRYTHSSTLRTIQEIFNLSPLLGDATTATDLGDLFGTQVITPQPTKIIAQAPTISPTPIPTIVSTVAPTREVSSIVTPTATISPTKAATTTLTVTPVPAAPIASGSWIAYKSDSMIANSGISFTSPAGWHILYEQLTSQEKIAYTPLRFLFFQPGMLVPSRLDSIRDHMSIDVYPTSASVESFIDTYYPQYKNKLAFEEYGTIGNKTMYRIAPRSDVALTDSVYANFGEHGIVLGSKHAYDIGFEKGTNYNIIATIEEIIWPSFKLE